MPINRCSCRSATLAYNSYVGRIGIGRIQAAAPSRQGMKSSCCAMATKTRVKAKIAQVHDVQGLEREQVRKRLEAGDIVLVTGIEQVGIGVTICDPRHRSAWPRWWSMSRR
jgi:GTP-binding protein